MLFGFASVANMEKSAQLNLSPLKTSSEFFIRMGRTRLYGLGNSGMVSPSYSMITLLFFLIQKIKKFNGAWTRSQWRFRQRDLSTRI